MSSKPEQVRSKEGQPVGAGQHGNQEQSPFTAHDDYTRDGVQPYWETTKPPADPVDIPDQCRVVCITDDLMGNAYWCDTCPNRPANKNNINEPGMETK